jgi:thiamine-phosphate pyrophosphorylase
VHVGQNELSVHEVRRIVGPDCLIGVSTHSIEQARQAVLDGANYIGVGPIFKSGTKSFNEFAGTDFVREVAAEIQLPWFPIGGINQTNLDEVIAAGALRIAISGAVCRSDNPRQASKELVVRLSNN